MSEKAADLHVLISIRFIPGAFWSQLIYYKKRKEIESKMRSAHAQRKKVLHININSKISLPISYR